jgi:uncharacterized protein (DUF4415 family)
MIYESDEAKTRGNFAKPCILLTPNRSWPAPAPRRYQKRLGGANRATDADIDYSNVRPPAKQRLTIRLVAGVLAWIEADGKCYQTRSNRI